MKNTADENRKNNPTETIKIKELDIAIDEVAKAMCSAKRILEVNGFEDAAASEIIVLTEEILKEKARISLLRY